MREVGPLLLLATWSYKRYFRFCSNLWCSAWEGGLDQ